MPCVRPWVPGMRVCVKSGRQLPNELVEFVCADPPPPLREVRERVAALTTPRVR